MANELKENIKKFMKGMLPLIDIRTELPDNSPKIEVVAKPGMCPICNKEKVGLDPTYLDNIHYKCFECGAVFQLRTSESTRVTTPVSCTTLIPISQWR